MFSLNSLEHAGLNEVIEDILLLRSKSGQNLRLKTWTFPNDPQIELHIRASGQNENQRSQRPIEMNQTSR